MKYTKIPIDKTELAMTQSLPKDSNNYIRKNIEKNSQ